MNIIYCHLQIHENYLLHILKTVIVEQEIIHGLSYISNIS